MKTKKIGRTTFNMDVVSKMSESEFVKSFSHICKDPKKVYKDLGLKKSSKKDDSE